MNLSGTPGVNTSITNLSIVTANQERGLICVLAATERGLPQKIYKVGNWIQFTRKLGGIIDGNDDALIIKLALEAGAVLYVGRLFHLTDIDDIATISGTEASETITESLNNIAFAAEAVGDGYNGTTIDITAAASGKAGHVDIAVQLPNSDTEAVIRDIDVTLVDQAAIDKINAKLKGVDAGVVVTAITTEIPIGTGTLTSGVQDLSELVNADYIGSQVSKTGLHVFDDVKDSMRIANINKADPDVDIAFAAYCVMRKDMRAITRTALGLGVTGVGDYRRGGGVYTHSPIDTFYGDLWYTDCEITDPEDSDIKNKVITALAFKLASRSKKDRANGEWFSDSGMQSGIGSFTKVNEIPINFLSPAYKIDYDSLYEDGVNAIVDHETFNVVPWGNRSLLLDKTSLLSKMNIADLVVVISRSLKALASVQSFKPNDFIMFNELYRRVRPFIVSLVDDRAIQGDNSATKGEGKWWHWFGDQFAQTPEDLTFNTPGDIDVGKYKARFAFKPIAANEYIAIDIAPADSATILNVQILQTV